MGDSRTLQILAEAESARKQREERRLAEAEARAKEEADKRSKDGERRQARLQREEEQRRREEQFQRRLVEDQEHIRDVEMERAASEAARLAQEVQAKRQRLGDSGASNHATVQSLASLLRG